MYSDFDNFQKDFENSLFSVLESIRKNNANPIEFYSCVFLCLTAHIKQPECFDLINSFITADDNDKKLFTEGFIEKITVLEKKKIQLANISAKEEDPIKTAIMAAKKTLQNPQT